MSNLSLEQLLDRIESQFNAVSFALVDGNPVAVHASSTSLQELAVQFVQLVDDLGRSGKVSAEVTRRVQALAKGMPALRENLLRRTAYVDQALALVIPATQKTTYSNANAQYGSALRQSGSLRVLTA
jgi:hypothetical protein